MKNKYQPWLAILIIGIVLKLLETQTRTGTVSREFSFINIFGTDITYSYGGLVFAIIIVALAMVVITWLKYRR